MPEMEHINKIPNPFQNVPKPELSSEEKATKHAAVHHASYLAIASNKAAAAQAKSASEYVKTTRTMLEFQLLNIQAQLSFLDDISSMNDAQKLVMLFDVLDKDGDNQIDARELADGFRKIRPDVAFAECLIAAVDAMAQFSDSDTKLNIVEFRKFLKTLMEGMECTFHEMIELLIMTVVFPDKEENTTKDVEKDDTEDLDQLVEKKKNFSKAINDVRMSALFKMFDINRDGYVDLKEIALGLYKLYEDMEKSAKIAMEALTMYDESNARKLNFEQFAQLIVNIVASEPNMRFEDVADSMTMVASKSIEITMKDLLILQVEDKMYNEAKKIEENNLVVDALRYGKMQRLFDLWDLDHDGFIDVSELVLGLRKFQDAKEIDDTVEDAVATMLTFDENMDQQLSIKEFALFLVKYAASSGADLHELIDFMVVVTALRDNDEFESAYINALKEAATEKVRDLEESVRTTESE